MLLHIEQRLVDRADNHPNKNFENDLADFITIHETANPDAGASAHASWMYRDGGAPYSWHATVDDSTSEDGTPMVYQSFLWSSQCWHAGDGAGGPGNSTSIGIELCVNNDLETFSGRVLDTAAELVAHLRRLGHGGQGIVQHKKWSGKHCPTRIIENDLWDDFLKRIGTLEVDRSQPSKIWTPKIEIDEEIEESMKEWAETWPVPKSELDQPGIPLVNPTPASISKPIKRNPPQKKTQEKSTNAPALIQGSRTLKKGAPEVLTTGGTGGLLALLKSVGVDVDIEVVIGVMVAVPPLIFAARRLLRDAIKTLKELRKAF